MAKSSVAGWLPVILADFAGTPVADFEVRLIDVDPARPGDLAALDPAVKHWIRDGSRAAEVVPADPCAHQLVLKVGMPVEQGVEPMNLKGLDWLADDPEGLAVEIASTLQDHVMDQLNTTWPEVIVDGRTVVLEPRFGPDRMPRWEGRGVEPCPFGQLADRLAEAAH